MLLALEEMEGCLTLVLQLAAETLVAVVETLRMLELLYRVNAEVDVPADEVVLIELRQFPDTIELALEATGRPLLVLLGEIARAEALSGNPRFVCDLEARDRPGDLLEFWPGVGISRGLRPLLQVEEPSSDLLDGRTADGGGGGGAFKPMIRLVTLLTVDATGCGSTGGGISSVGDARPRLAVRVEALALPKLSFQREGFFVTVAGGDAGGGGDGIAELLVVRGLSKGSGIAYTETGSKDCWLRDDVVEVFVAVDCLLSSLARD